MPSHGIVGGVGYGFMTGVRSSRKLEGAGVAPGLLGDGHTRVSGTASLT